MGKRYSLVALVLGIAMASVSWGVVADKACPGGAELTAKDCKARGAGVFSCLKLELDDCGDHDRTCLTGGIFNDSPNKKTISTMRMRCIQEESLPETDPNYLKDINHDCHAGWEWKNAKRWRGQGKLAFECQEGTGDDESGGDDSGWGDEGDDW